jgi:mono/diheme cytochrome c family protein
MLAALIYPGRAGLGMSEVDKEASMSRPHVLALWFFALGVSGSLAAEPAKSAPTKTAGAKTDADAAKTKAKLLAAETHAWQAATPALQKHCATCHTKDGKSATRKRLDHFNFTSYPVGGHHAAKIGFTVRSVLGLERKKASMPFGKAGTVTGDDLAAIKAWTEAWDAADKGGAHAPQEHAHETKAEPAPPKAPEPPKQAEPDPKDSKPPAGE